jgi:hypothetical protein
MARDCMPVTSIAFTVRSSSTKVGRLAGSLFQQFFIITCNATVSKISMQERGVEPHLDFRPDALGNSRPFVYWSAEVSNSAQHLNKQKKACFQVKEDQIWY